MTEADNEGFAEISRSVSELRSLVQGTQAEQLRKLENIDGRMGAVEKTCTKTEKILTGNGDPASGLVTKLAVLAERDSQRVISELDRNASDKERRETRTKWLVGIVCVLLGQAGAMAGAMWFVVSRLQK